MPLRRSRIFIRLKPRGAAGSGAKTTTVDSGHSIGGHSIRFAGGRACSGVVAPGAKPSACGDRSPPGPAAGGILPFPGAEPMFSTACGAVCEPAPDAAGAGSHCGGSAAGGKASFGGPASRSSARTEQAGSAAGGAASNACGSALLSGADSIFSSACGAISGRTIGRRETPVSRRAMAPDGVWPAASTLAGLHDPPSQSSPSHSCFPHLICRASPEIFPTRREDGRGDRRRQNRGSGRARARSSPRGRPPSGSRATSRHRPRAAPR